MPKRIRINSMRNKKFDNWFQVSSFFNINISNLTSLDKVGEYLKNYKINGVTDAQIDNLLKIYQEEWKN